MNKSQCGTSTSARKAKDNQQREAQGLKTSQKEWRRKAPYDFTGCLGHIDVTFRVLNTQILRITGVLTHNEECLKQNMQCLPAVPLHNHVWQVALRQLEEGARYL